MTNKYYIEFVGVNGSGKTTLADKLSDRFRAQSRSILELPHKPGEIKPSRDLAQRIPQMLRYYARHPLSFLNCVYTRWNPVFGYRGSLHTLLKRRYETEKHFGKNVDIIIHHEGSFQFYRTTGHNFAGTSRLPGYHTIFHARSLGYHPVIVNLNVEIDFVLERCNTQRMSVPDPSGWSLAGEPPDRIRKIMADWTVKKDKIVELIRKNGIPVIDVSTGLAISESFEYLLAQLDAVLPPNKTVLSDRDATKPSGSL